ncbi:hypothetical protein BH23ACT9_BH23ACT9_10310 [soil metagenome]
MTTALRTRPTLTAAPLEGWSAVTVHPVVRLLQRTVLFLLWRPLVALVGPLRLTGAEHLPPGPCVLVADHASHADAIAIRVALHRAGRRRVVAAAAEDYWFARQTTAVIAVLAAGAFPLPRHGDVGLQRAAALLRAGYDVILFPQGSRDSTAREWRSGAGRLAVDTGATLVPVRLVGADAVLPKGARRLHANPVGVGIGPAVRAWSGDGPESKAAGLSEGASSTDDTGSTEDAGEVTARARQAAADIDVPTPTDGRLVRLSRALRANAIRRGVLILAVWAFAEATVWPLVPDLLLAGTVVAMPALALRLTVAATTASALGGGAALLLGRAGWEWPLLAVTPRMPIEASAAIAADGAAGMLTQPLSGIPYKVFNAAAVHTDVDIAAWMGWTVLARGARMGAVALVAAGVGRLLWSARIPRAWSERLHGLGVLTGLVLFTAGWSAVLLLWR